MPRYLLRLQFDGTGYAGWQVQPGVPTIQQEIQSAIGKLTNREILVVGCGRTDAGVHATDFYAHYDCDIELPLDFTYHLNKVLPGQIAILEYRQVSDDWHSRFDAVKRSYRYDIRSVKNPFRRQFEYYYSRIQQTDMKVLNNCAELIAGFTDFRTFCKARHQLTNYECAINLSQWKIDEDHALWSYEISANRFLRGMVRLIVGMCINVAFGKLEMEEVRHCLEGKKRLPKDWSVPAHGLHLTEVKYNF